LKYDIPKIPKYEFIKIIGRGFERGRSPLGVQKGAKPPFG